LALAAAIAGYLTTKDAVRGTLVSPHAAFLRRHLHDLRAEAVRRRDTLAALDVEIERALAHAEYLLATHPLRGWEGEAERLRAVVPRFRSENALRRGVDTASIAAFAKTPALDLDPGGHGAPPPPPELPGYRARQEMLRGRAGEV